MSKQNSYLNYVQLLSKVDEWFDAMFRRHEKHFSCARGCFGCCKSGLSVLPVEADYIKYWVKKNPEVEQKLKSSELMGSNPAFCEFIDHDGGCSIYEARPIICRSHGTPVSFLDDATGSERRDVCPLNFRGTDIESLAASDLLSLDKVNTLLSLINRQFLQSNEVERVSLSRVFKEITTECE